MLSRQLQFVGRSVTGRSGCQRQRTLFKLQGFCHCSGVYRRRLSNFCVAGPRRLREASREALASGLQPECWVAAGRSDAFFMFPLLCSNPPLCTGPVPTPGLRARALASDCLSQPSRKRLRLFCNTLTATRLCLLRIRSFVDRFPSEFRLAAMAKVILPCKGGRPYLTDDGQLPCPFLPQT